MVKKAFNPIRLTLWIPGVQADKRVKKMENEGDMNSKDKGNKIENMRLHRWSKSGGRGMTDQVWYL